MGLRRNKKLKTRLAGSQPVRVVRVAGSRPQGPVGQVSKELGVRAPRAWGPAHQGPGANLLVGDWQRSAETAALEVGTWRETKPGYPPPTPPHFGAKAAIQHAPQGRRISQNKGTQFKCPHTVILLMGTPNSCPKILGHPT